MSNVVYDGYTNGYQEVFPQLSVPAVAGPLSSAGTPKVFAYNAFIGNAAQGGSGLPGFSLLPSGNATRAAAVANAMQRGVAGISYTFPLATIWTAPGVYQWQYVASAIADMAPYPDAQAILRFIGGFRSPAWLLALVSTVVNASGKTVPVPWDSTYLTNMKAFTAAFGQQFGAQAASIYQVDVTVGMDSAEMTLDGSVNTVATTVSGTYTAGASTMNVASTTGFPTAGSVIVVGVGTVNYTGGGGGGTSFTGCSGGSGTSAASAPVQSPQSYQAIWSSNAANNSLAFNTAAGGYTDAKYATGAVGTSAWPTMIDSYHSAWPNTRLGVALDEPFGNITNPDTSAHTACVAGIMTLGDTGGAYAGTFAVQQNGLDEGDLGIQNSGRKRPQIRRARYGGSGMLGGGYQFVKAEGFIQNLRDCLQVAQQDGVDYVETYTSDIIAFPELIQLFTALPALGPSQGVASQFLFAPDQSSPLATKTLSAWYFSPTSGSPVGVTGTTSSVTVNANGTLVATFTAPHSFSPDQRIIGTSFGTITNLNTLEYLITSCTETTVTAEPTGAAATAGTDTSGGVFGISWPQYAIVPDNGFFWFQTAASPTNSPVWSPSGAKLATTVANPAAPGATSSTTLVFGGLAIAFTPLVSGLVAATIAGTGSVATGITGFNVEGKYGTGTAPTALSSATGVGTAFPQGVLGIRPASIGGGAAWTLIGALSGLTVGTAYWFDVAFDTNSGSDAVTLANISALILER